MCCGYGGGSYGRCRDVNNGWGVGSSCCSRWVSAAVMAKGTQTMGTLATAAVANMNPAVAVTMAATVRGGGHDKRNGAAWCLC